MLAIVFLPWALARAPANFATAPTCGSCAARGGAWCVDTSRCVPDVRGACSAPEQQVGVVGTGQCLRQHDHALASYLHAPRHNPLETLRRTAEPDAREMGCKTSATWCRDLQRLSGAQDTAEEARKRLDICGLVLLDGAFDPIELRKLRAYAASKLPIAETGPTTDGDAARSKYEIPGVRGNRRKEWILPHDDKIAATIVRGLRGRIDAVVGIAPRDLAIEMVSLIVSWPGADAQAFHRDAAAAHAAVSFVFVPLDAMPHNGPQFCPCSHVAGSPEVCQKSSAGRLSLPPELLPLGGAIVYDAGLVHRGLAYDAKGGNGKARVLLHVAIAPRGAPLRSRPTALLGASAQEHIRRWRAHSLARDGAPSCAAASTCSPCLAVAGCAWCVVDFMY